MKVIKPFTCRVTKIRYEAGQEYTGPRGEELAAKGFVERKEKAEVSHVPKQTDPTPKKKTKKQTP